MNTPLSLIQIQSALDAGDPKEALRIAAICEENEIRDARLFCLKGKAYMKLSDWHEAQSAFLHAEELEPHGASAQYLSMLADIMNFYNKDMYNQ